MVRVHELVRVVGQGPQLDAEVDDLRFPGKDELLHQGWHGIVSGRPRESVEGECLLMDLFPLRICFGTLGRRTAGSERELLAQPLQLITGEDEPVNVEGLDLEAVKNLEEVLLDDALVLARDTEDDGPPMVPGCSVALPAQELSMHCYM